MRLAPVAVSALLMGLPAVPALEAQEEPLTAGSEGVAAPKRIKTVQPEYPLEAQAQGIRGIVILELTIDKEGKVAEVKVVRSVPGLDDAAVTAARQWTYGVTKVDGKPVSVRLAVPITFAMRLPEMSRQDGIPELRQGVSPPFPKDANGPATVLAEVTLDPDGRVAEWRVVQGEAPWTNALLAALRTWRFAPDQADVVVSFRVQADFIPGERRNPPKVNLRLDGLRRSESMARGPEPTAPVEPAPGPATEEGRATEGPATEPPAATGAATMPDTGAPQGGPPPSAAPPPPGPPADATPTASTGSATGEAAPSPAQAGPPPVEVITAPPPPPPPLDAEAGTSAVREVTLEAGVPDLVRGRRPVPPPFARMTATSGTVEVQFSVSAAGTCLVQSVSGLDLLKAAAEQAVASWQFRRTQAHRLFLAAIFTYEGDRATAVVRPQGPVAPPTPSHAESQPQP